MGIPYTDADPTDAPETTELPEWSAILDAPDITGLTKGAKTATTREYERKVQSVLKAGLQFTLSSPATLPDAAAILAYGPGFALRAGELADSSERARTIIDLVTAPDNPVFLFAVAALPFVSQLFRNHEASVKALPGKVRDRRQMTREERKAARATQPRAEFKIPVIGKKIRVPFRLRLPLGFLRTQTRDPAELTHAVFSNTDVCKALHKAYGVTIAPNGSSPHA